MKKLIGLFVLLVFAAAMSYAAENVTADGQAKAKIIQAATLTHVTNAALDFGSLIKDADGGSSQLDPVASPTAHDTGLQRVTAVGVSSDHFTLAGLDSATTYNLSVQSPVTITKSGGSETMSVAPTLSETQIQNPAQATKDIYVGGTLTVGSDQAVGDYSGSYTVTLTY